MTDPYVVICELLGLTRVPNTLRSSVYKIRMNNNSISDIDDVEWPKSLISLALADNQIGRLRDRTFIMAPNMKKIYLNSNQINEIQPDAFAGLAKLSWLYLDHNKLETFDTSLLKHSPLIKKIDLTANNIDLPDETQFGLYKHIEELFLDHNRISRIRAHWFSNMSSLGWLSLAHNRISVIEDKSFMLNTHLVDLDLSANRIKHINRLTFAYQLSIHRLVLESNRQLKLLPENTFAELPQLKSLNLKSIEFDYLEPETFSHLQLLDFIYFAKFRYCHYATHVRVCHPLTDGLSSTKELLAFPILKYAVWIVALVCSLGNVFVFVWRTVSPHEDQSLSLFVRNLSIADLMMGIYLCVIGWQNRNFGENFSQHAIKWMSSWQCASIGFLAILSSELSVFILTIITVERYRSITSIRRFGQSEKKRRARVYVSLAWLCSLLIALYPMLEWLWNKNSHQPNQTSASSLEYYAQNGLCLPLHIDQPFTPGWQFIYLAINFTAVLVIIALYVRLYLMIMSARQTTRPVAIKAEKREDAILAIRFFFIVVTDCLCWIPIVVIKLIALCNVSISSAIYGWLVVFIIPVNSALNPIIYTLAAPTLLRSHVCRLFERLFYKLDLILPGGSSRHCSNDGVSNCLVSVPRDSSDSGKLAQSLGPFEQAADAVDTTCQQTEPTATANKRLDADFILICNGSELAFALNDQPTSKRQQVPAWPTKPNLSLAATSGSDEAACCGAGSGGCPKQHKTSRTCDFFSTLDQSSSQIRHTLSKQS